METTFFPVTAGGCDIQLGCKINTAKDSDGGFFSWHVNESCVSNAELIYYCFLILEQPFKKERDQRTFFFSLSLVDFFDFFFWSECGFFWFL